MDNTAAHHVGAATLERVHATLMSALGTTVRRGLIDRNPAETVELPVPARPELVVWTAEQMGEFLGGIVDDDVYPVFLLLALCGLRRGEAVGLRWFARHMLASPLLDPDSSRTYSLLPICRACRPPR